MEREKELRDLEEQRKNLVIRSCARKALINISKNLKQMTEARYIITRGQRWAA